VENGLKARTKILDTLEKRFCNAASIAKVKSLSYSVVMHHLRLLENEGVVARKGKRAYIWLLTGLGQKRLDH
jgi:DNA-binding transcriptional ArsR family regulator